MKLSNLISQWKAASWSSQDEHSRSSSHHLSRLLLVHMYRIHVTTLILVEYEYVSDGE
jgi:hypothetical protein